MDNNTGNENTPVKGTSETLSEIAKRHKQDIAASAQSAKESLSVADRKSAVGKPAHQPLVHRPDQYKAEHRPLVYQPSQHNTHAAQAAQTVQAAQAAQATQAAQAAQATQATQAAQAAQQAQQAQAAQATQAAQTVQAAQAAQAATQTQHSTEQTNAIKANMAAVNSLRQSHLQSAQAEAEKQQELINRQQQRKKAKKAIAAIIIIAVLLIAALLGIYFIRSKNTPVDTPEPIGPEVTSVVMFSSSVSTASITANVPEGTVYPEGIQDKYKAIYAVNNDFSGWLKIDGTCIDTPVYQSSREIPEYYLKHDIWGNYSRYGTPFLDCGVNFFPGSMSNNVVIYAHNFDDDQDGKYEDLNFGEIERYQNIEFYKQHPVIEFNTIYKDYKWKVFAAFVSNGSSNGDNGYLFNYAATPLSIDSFTKFVQAISERSLISTSVDVQPTDKLLLLSTCTYQWDRGGKLQDARSVLVARLVREGEDESVDVSAAAQIAAPRMPQLYYDVMGGANPYLNSEKWLPG